MNLGCTRAHEWRRFHLLSSTEIRVLNFTGKFWNSFSLSWGHVLSDHDQRFSWRPFLRLHQWPGRSMVRTDLGPTGRHWSFIVFWRESPLFDQ